MTIHKLRSIGASILLILTMASLSYFLLNKQYQELLQFYQAQGERAYVVAFIRIFLDSPLSIDLLIVFLPTTFLLALVLLRNWKDGLLTGLSTGMIVSLLDLYMIMKNYFPDVLTAGWPVIIADRMLLGTEKGLLIGLPALVGGFLRSKITARQLQVSIPPLEAEKKTFKCPRCGTEFRSNPKICSNCGRKLR